MRYYHETAYTGNDVKYFFMQGRKFNYILNERNQKRLGFSSFRNGFDLFLETCWIRELECFS